MAGRKKHPGAEVRDKRTSVRWTRSEYERLEKARHVHQVEYLVDVPRIMTLKQLRLEEVIGDKADDLEAVREMLGLDSMEDVLWVLASRQLELMSSALKRDVAE